MDLALHHRSLLRLYYYIMAAILLMDDEESTARSSIQGEDPEDEEAAVPRPPRRRIRRRATWVREWLSRRPLHGQYDQLLTELHREDLPGYRNFLRITLELFHEMVERVTPILEKQRTPMRAPLDMGLKLAVTLRFLATGECYASLQYSFRVARNTISIFVPEVCKAIIQVYKKEVLRCPKTAEEWKAVAEGYAT